MTTPVLIILVAWLAGLAAFAGGALARLEGSAESPGKHELVRGMVALGGGVLLAAVAFALAPEAVAYLSVSALAASFLAGGLVFALADAWLSRRRGSQAQFMAMLLDFVPEAISLGAVFGHDRRLGLLLAAFIGMQNLPEGFNSFRDLRAAGQRGGAILFTLLAVSLLGPAAALAGHWLLQDQKALTAGIMSFAGGGILYLVFQDIAPRAANRRHWTPALGAVLGFLCGMLGHKLLG